MKIQKAMKQTKTLETMGKLYEQLSDGKTTLDDVCRSDGLISITQKLETAKKLLQNSREAKLWLQFMQIMDILRKLM